MSLNLTVTVDGTDRTSQIRWRTFRKQDRKDEQADELSFETITPGGGSAFILGTSRLGVGTLGGSETFVPTTGQAVTVTDGSGDKVFDGQIIRVEKEVEGKDTIRYKVRCKDHMHELDRQLVNKKYTDQTVKAIVQDIITNFTSGFTSNNVDGSGIDISSVTFNRVPVSEAIGRLARQTGFSWYVDYDKDVHFFTTHTEPAPFDLTDDSGNYIYDSLRIIDDISQIRNVVLIEGGEIEGDVRTEIQKTDGSTDTFGTDNKFASEPTVTLNGTVQDVGVDFLDKDSNHDVMWNFNEKYIRFTSTPSADSTVKITSDPLFPILAEVKDDDSIDRHGEYQFTEKDKSISTDDEARDFGIAQLEQYADGVKEGEFRTYTSGLRSGQIINISSDNRQIYEDFLIQSVKLQMRGPDEGEYRVSLAKLRTVGITQFLIDQLREGKKIVEEDEDEVLKKYRRVEEDIEVAEDLAVASGTSFETSVTISENVRTDPFDPIFVLAPGHPDDLNDRRRKGRLGVSFRLGDSQ